MDAMMDGSTNQILLIYTLVMLQWFYLFNPIAAMTAFDLGEAEALRGINYHKAWYKLSDSTQMSATDHLRSYLESSIEDRKNSDPFFSCPDSLDEDSPGVDSLKLMNSMLQSETKTWPQYIQQILMTKPSYKIKNFWGFISEISDFMPTSVLQSTFFQVSKEKELLLRERGWKRLSRKRIFEKVLLRYEDKLKDHVRLLEQKERPKEVMNIFTRQEQEKLGEYKIQLENNWSPREDVELYKNWASHMRVYMEVQGLLKGALETQVIQVRYIQLNRLYPWGAPPLPSLVRQLVGHWLLSHCEAMTNKLVDYIHLMENESFMRFWTYQKAYNYGIHDTWSNFPNQNTKQSLIFWVKYMPFYLKMKSNEETWDWYQLMEEMIVKDTGGDHLESAMREFLIHTPPSNPQKNLIVTFIEFVLETTGSESLREFAKEALGTITENHTPLLVKRIKEAGAGR